MPRPTPANFLSCGAALLVRAAAERLLSSPFDVAMLEEQAYDALAAGSADEARAAVEAAAAFINGDPEFRAAVTFNPAHHRAACIRAAERKR